jgi:hypothetical protein
MVSASGCCYGDLQNSGFADGNFWREQLAVARRNRHAINQTMEFARKKESGEECGHDAKMVCMNAVRWKA